jgi:hypothetical protein
MEGRSRANLSASHEQIMHWYRQEKHTISSRLFFVILIFMALFGVVIVLSAIPWGAGLSDDSWFYIKPACDILAGRNLFLPPLIKVV